MRNNKYILKGHTPVVEPDVLTWAKWLGTANRTVALTGKNGVTISTVFLGLDHNFLSDGAPILFETVVFGGEHDQEQERYATWDGAEIGHQKMVERCIK